MDGNELIAGFAVSTIGGGFFMYGKKQSRPPQMILGLLTFVYPYVVGGVLPILGIFVALLLLMWIAIRAGF